MTSDEFELRLGLARTARNEWARITEDPGQDAARQALIAYAQGVNDDIAQVRAAGDWPAIDTLTGAYPAPWTPVDSLAASIVPRLRAVLASASSGLTPRERQAAGLLGSWNDQMSVNSAAATIWWQFWSEYLSQVFQPWWTAGHVRRCSG